ncbi:hypothetical protein [Spirosoma radiotolerans]|uniref:Uncharacterized protein n=1 Tax=Spirosoma radiotolerans TaxID=1379870 RepID=A0A0E3ZX65_9BACT|nr:hypothetical protein [Spirosoma radiotolerans]AKD56193.1 hypothetical protein SD10_16105 [Spirosoma radiotolerans]
MSSNSENLKVIFYEPASENKAGHVIADAYFSFVPTFKEGDEINIALSRKETANEAVHDPIGHKTHQIVKTDWVMMIDERTKEALATLVVSVSVIAPQASVVSEFPTIVGTHA